MSRSRPKWWVGIAVAAAAGLLVTSNIVSPLAPATASAGTFDGVGSADVAAPGPGSRAIYVSTSGSDTHEEWKQWYNGGDWRSYNRFVCLDDPARQPSSQIECPEPTVEAPLATIQMAIRIAKPGDVIVVRAGIYPEALGWGARAATSAMPIVLQSFPGEEVEVKGTLILKSADYWTVRGIHFIYNSAIQNGESIVTIAGGHGWTFAHNEVAGSTGVANVLIRSAVPTDTSTTARTKAAPQNYAITGNCIRSNNGTGTRGTYHNIYLMSTIYSVGGLIEHNLIAGAPRGANIKAAGSGPSTSNDSPRNVVIRYNTLLYAASGITIGLKAEWISTEKNIIALPSQSQSLDGGVKTYQLNRPGRNAVKDSLITGYNKPISEDWGVSEHIFVRRINTTTPFSYTGSVANCSVVADSPIVRDQYGQHAGL